MLSPLALSLRQTDICSPAPRPTFSQNLVAQTHPSISSSTLFQLDSYPILFIYTPYRTILHICSIASDRSSNSLIATSPLVESIAAFEATVRPSSTLWFHCPKQTLLSNTRHSDLLRHCSDIPNPCKVHWILFSTLQQLDETARDQHSHIFNRRVCIRSEWATSDYNLPILSTSAFYITLIDTTDTTQHWECTTSILRIFRATTDTQRRSIAFAGHSLHSSPTSSSAPVQSTRIRTARAQAALVAPDRSSQCIIPSSVED